MDPKTIPSTLRGTLRAACGGDWDRVVCETDGSFTVLNHPVAPTVVDLTSEPLRMRVPCPWDNAPEPTFDLPAPAASLPRVGDPTRKPPATVDTPPLLSLDDETPLLSPAPSADVIAALDWTTVELDTAVTAVQQRCAGGLPAAVQYAYLPDVLAMCGTDFDLLDSAIRNPARVEIRPESKKKGYAVLAFHRGDLEAIVGFRIPARPMVIAVYVGALIENDSYRVDRHPGGGARKASGLPKTARAVVAQLRERGCDIGEGEASALVCYRGQELGRVSVGHGTPRAAAESDWQRMVRKIQAIDSRAAVAV